MTTAVQALAIVAILANAVIYGTDVFSAVVQRPALAHVDDRALIAMMGNIHRYGDRRLPVPGTIGLLAALAGAITAAVAGLAPAAVAGFVACAALLAWLVFFNKVAAPVNRQLAKAAENGGELPEARSLQDRSDGALGALVLFQSVALIAQCVMVTAA
ncbi:hypothetical protein [Actinomadura sp. NEAU-AAG7]|uniref:hypothetical protein n=1 Tax=Actinomadura sp. NEAU-AAG7 TaxID=2839640 RepID=UPI001BE4D816|nr:hypothetical protein [Actinomadura sp. NEAU-AAG7]MBT2212414.1 hypothetical protein [Actinomadura sp. NEAU-AAG7]